MAKLPNTQGNRTKVLIGCAGAFAALAYFIARPDEKKSFIVGGAILGLMASQGISSLVIDKKK